MKITHQSIPHEETIPFSPELLGPHQVHKGMFVSGREALVLVFIDWKNMIVPIPDGVTKIGANVFSETPFNVALIPAGVEVDPNAFNYKTVEIVNGVFNSKSARALVAQQGRNVAIPDGFKFIEAYSFSENQFDFVTFSSKTKTRSAPIEHSDQSIHDESKYHPMLGTIERTDDYRIHNSRPLL